MQRFLSHLDGFIEAALCSQDFGESILGVVQVIVAFPFARDTNLTASVLFGEGGVSLRRGRDCRIFQRSKAPLPKGIGIAVERVEKIRLEVDGLLVLMKRRLEIVGEQSKLSGARALRRHLNGPNFTG